MSSHKEDNRFAPLNALSYEELSEMLKNIPALSEDSSSIRNEMDKSSENMAVGVLESTDEINEDQLGLQDYVENTNKSDMEADYDNEPNTLSSEDGTYINEILGNDGPNSLESYLSELPAEEEVDMFETELIAEPGEEEVDMFETELNVEPGESLPHEIESI